MSGRLPDDFKEQVRQATDIVDLIGSFIPLKRAGARFRAVCPFHKEKTPSFNVEPRLQIFKCFGCGASGDAFKFIQLYENLDFPGALRRLADRAHIAIPETTSFGAPEDRSKKEKLYDLHSAVSAWWSQLLRKDPDAEIARTYLKGRDFNSELAREFGLGYAPPGWDSTLNWCRAQGFEVEVMSEAGLIRQREGSSGYYDFFRGRLMIPIRDDSGRVVAFSGRLLDPEAKTAKYVNSPETPIFTKGRVLFGLDKTKRAIIDAGQAIVCEGQLDLMRCWEKGVQNVVAPQGTAFTDTQARLLGRFAKEVVLCFDADNAGQNAAARSVDLLLAEGFTVRMALMPKGEDPDSFLRANPPEAFRERLAAAPDYITFLVRKAGIDHDLKSPAGLNAAGAQLAAVVAKIAEPIQRERALNFVSNQLQVTPETLKRLVDRATKAPQAPSRYDEGEAPRDEPIQDIEVSAPVAMLLSLLLEDERLATDLQRKLNPAWISDLAGSSLLNYFLEEINGDDWDGPQAFLQSGPESERNALTRIALQPPPRPPDTTGIQLLEATLSSIHLRWVDRRIRILQNEIKSNILDPGKLTELQELLATRSSRP